MTTDNGILNLVPGGIIGGASAELPRPGPEQQADPIRHVERQVRDLGLVRITYELANYRHGKSRHWHWQPVRADQLEVR